MSFHMYVIRLALRISVFPLLHHLWYILKAHILFQFSFTVCIPRLERWYFGGVVHLKKNLVPFPKWWRPIMEILNHDHDTVYWILCAKWQANPIPTSQLYSTNINNIIQQYDKELILIPPQLYRSLIPTHSSQMPFVSKIYIFYCKKRHSIY